MKAMILAAGGGTRLYPLTHTLPKPMAPILNKPVMEHIIVHLKKYGFSRFMLNLHNMPDQIRAHFGDGSQLGVEINYSMEDEPLGTAGGVKKVEEFFDGTFLVIGGDDLLEVDLARMLEFHKQSKALVTIGLSHEEEVEQYGVVVVNDDGRVMEFQEKPPSAQAKSHWVNNGIYFFEPEILKYIPQDEFYDFGSQLFPRLKEMEVPFFGYKTKGYWKDIGNLREYRNAQIDALTGKLNLCRPGKEIQPGIWVEEGVDIAETARLTAPLLIGRNSKVGENVTIEGPASLGKFNTLEDGVTLSHTIMWDFNHMKSGSKLVDCLVGSECVIEKEEQFCETILGSGRSHVIEDYFTHRGENAGVTG